MTKWIQMTRTRSDGLPVVRSIKTPEMNRPIFFSTTAKAEVAEWIADLLIEMFDDVVETDSSNPGEPIERRQPAFRDRMVRYRDGRFEELFADEAFINTLEGQTIKATAEPYSATDVARLREVDDVKREVETIEGISEGRNNIEAYLFDDFGDSSLTNRTQQITGWFLPPDGTKPLQGHYRPTWSVENNITKASDEHAYDFAAARAIARPTELYNGYWELDIRHNANAFQNGVVIYPYVNDAVTRYWRIYTQSNGRVLLEYRTPSDTGAVLAAQSEPGLIKTGVRQTLGLRRRPGGEWTLWVDGREALQTTNSWLPDPTEFSFLYRIRTQSNTTCRIHRINVRSTRGAPTEIRSGTIRPDRVDSPDIRRSGQQVVSAASVPHQRISPRTPLGDYATADNAMLLSADSPIHLGKCRVDANFTGELTIRASPFTENVGWPIGSADAIAERTVTIPSTGEHIIDLDMLIPPQQNKIALWRTNRNNRPLRRILLGSDEDVFPQKYNGVTVHGGGGGSSGSVNTGWYWFYDLRVATADQAPSLYETEDALGSQKSVATPGLTGSVVNRSAPITALSGNQFVQSSKPADTECETNDIWYNV